jgi:hypothetical protein
MGQQKRILVAVVILVIIAILVLGFDWLQRRAASKVGELEPGSVPIYLDGELVGAFLPGDLAQLEKVSFVDTAEGETQEGWMLADILLLYIPTENLDPQALVLVSSSSRDKSAQLTWAEVAEEANLVMFDLSNRGTLKLVSLLPALDDRDEWVQDTDRIEVTTP